jgi:hypothetical protein
MLNFSKAVALFSIISGPSGARQRNSAIASPHFKREIRPRSAGHLVPGLRIRNRPPKGAIRTEERNHDIQESNKEAPEGQEAAKDFVSPSLAFKVPIG